MAGLSKNNPANKKGESKSNLVLSEVCEQCKSQCSKGQVYLRSMKLGKAGKGVRCILL